MSDWVLLLVWSIIEDLVGKSCVGFSNFFLSIVAWYRNFFLLSSDNWSNWSWSSNCSGWSFFSGISFWGSDNDWGWNDNRFVGRKLLWNVSSWSLRFIKRSWSWFWSGSNDWSSWYNWLFNSFLLVVSTWIWCLVWVIDIFEIILVGGVFKVEWLLELLNTIMFLINFLWNKTSWAIWVDFLLNKSLSFVWSSLGTSRFSWSSIFSISFPSVRGLSHNSSGVLSINKIWLT